MKNTIRVRRNGVTKSRSSQSKIPRIAPRKASATDQPAKSEELLTPSVLVIVMETALANMRRVGNAAVAFVMMTGNIISLSAKDSGMENLDAPGFNDGSRDLARLVSKDFQYVLGDLFSMVETGKAAMCGCNEPLKWDSRGGRLTAIDALDPKRSWSRIGSMVESLDFCIEMQSWAICLYDNASPLGGFFEMQRNLREAHEELGTATVKFLDSFCAVSAENKNQKLAA